MQARFDGPERDSRLLLLPLSVAVLAGGKSSRMGEDKAFLRIDDEPFVSLIVREMKNVSDDIYVFVGGKERGRFSSVIGPDPCVTILGDSRPLGGPVGGLLSAFDVIEKSKYVAAVACDTPFVKAGIFRALYSSLGDSSAIIPVWPNGRVEPLCAIYEKNEAKRAVLRALADGGGATPSCRGVISNLRNPKYIDVEELRCVDPELRSFLNLNTKEDLLGAQLAPRPRKEEFVLYS